MNVRIFEAQAELCRAFTHPTRIQVLELLADGEHSVTEMVEASGVPQPTLSQHLSVLRGKGVVTTRRDGTTVLYRLSDDRILEACRLMREILAEQYRKLGERAATPAPRKPAGKKKRTAAPARGRKARSRS